MYSLKYDRNSLFNSQLPYSKAFVFRAENDIEIISEGSFVLIPILCNSRSNYSPLEKLSLLIFGIMIVNQIVSYDQGKN